MRFIDVLIPLTGGILLVACPQLFFKSNSVASDEEAAKKRKMFRKIGCFLLVAAAAYLVLAVVRPS